jgi:hypothetical protein
MLPAAVSTKIRDFPIRYQGFPVFSFFDLSFIL